MRPRGHVAEPLLRKLPGRAQAPGCEVRTLVLLSGGLDSVAALIWAVETGHDPHALFFDYGQPAAQHEIESALGATRVMRVPFHRCDIRSAFGGQASGLFFPSASSVLDGIDTAFVPCRNVVLLTAAAARAGVLWPGEDAQLITGFNRPDGAGFPDCTHAFTALLEDTINLGNGAKPIVKIRAPWRNETKREIVEWVAKHAPHRSALLEQSWSCYRGRGPCGECTACVTRVKAL
jgi:7-cyano-7-deazaguanine synthase